MSAIKFRKKKLFELYDTDSPDGEVYQLNFITCIEVGHMTRHYSKSNKLRNVNTVRGKFLCVSDKKHKESLTNTGYEPVVSLSLTFKKYLPCRGTFWNFEDLCHHIMECRVKVSLHYQAAPVSNRSVVSSFLGGFLALLWLFLL